jgi:Raf kinase inhibitor-like YbhB/YbcL family protein
VGAIVAGCSSANTSRRTAVSTPPVSVVRVGLTSADFTDGGTIPRDLSCQGQQRMPALSWTAAPPTTAEFELTVEDPDAPGGPFAHWVVTGIPATATSIPATGATDNGWRGPCPPAGPAHHYVFTLYAVSRPLGLSPGASPARVRDAANGVTRGVGRLVGLYQRVSG